MTETMPDWMEGVRVGSRDGRVLRNAQPIGWVDRWDAGKFKPTRTWRGVKEGGRSASGFKTRADAALWVATP